MSRKFIEHFLIPDHENVIAELESQGIHIRHDTSKQQWREWFSVNHPVLKTRAEAFEAHFDAFYENSIDLPTLNWVVYPWLNTAVRILPEKEFSDVRTARNKNKITESEQHLLSQKKVGIIGLSVGQSAAIAIAMERSSGLLRLADFDTLDLSNLNRLRAGVHQIGLSKCSIAARSIAELDPYLTVELFEEGINANNLGSFLNGLDVLIEESDSLEIKVMARILAKERGIPVIMDTSDRGMLDVERFDLEPQRPLFHGLVEELETIKLHQLTVQERMALLMKIVDFQSLSIRLKSSFAEIGKTLLTWPQLASDIAAGSGHAAEAYRRIALGQNMPSGRYYTELIDPTQAEIW